MAISKAKAYLKRLNTDKPLCQSGGPSIAVLTDKKVTESRGFVETLMNFFMGFSTALLPAMIFIAYFLHKNGHEVTSKLEKQLHQTVMNLNTTRDTLVTFKKRLANSEKNNIELTKSRDKVLAELDQLRAEIAENKIQYTKTTKTVVETIKNDHDGVVVEEPSNPEPIQVEEIEDQKEWVREQLASVKAQLNTLKQNHRESFPGYVYVMANEVCFGKDQLLIRATKRLEPMDVVRDLGDDPKRFQFDVKMVLFHQDAPELEENLHKALKEKCLMSAELNVKLFNVELEEISQAMEAIKKKTNKSAKQKAIAAAATPVGVKHAA